MRSKYNALIVRYRHGVRNSIYQSRLWKNGDVVQRTIAQHETDKHVKGALQCGDTITSVATVRIHTPTATIIQP